MITENTFSLSSSGRLLKNPHHLRAWLHYACVTAGSIAQLQLKALIVSCYATHSCCCHIFDL